MKLAQIFKDFEKKTAQGEEAESLSFVYRSLKIYLTDFIFTLQQEVTDEEKDFVGGNL